MEWVGRSEWVRRSEWVGRVEWVRGGGVGWEVGVG